MKTFRIFSIMLLALLALGSCSTDEVVAPGTSQAGAPNVRFTLGGAAKTNTTSRAIQQTIEGEENENRVENVLALLYDTHDGFVEAVDARPEGDGEYSIVVEKDGTYLIYFVANADDALSTALKAIAPGTKAEDSEKGLETIVAEQAIGGGNNFLMLCQAPECITTQITKTQSVGEVHMVRLASRFDIINGAEGVTLNKVTFKNNVVKSSLMTRNEMTTETEADGWFTTKTYDLNLEGNKGDDSKYEAQVYSYENYSAKDSETLPVITIEYTEEGKTKTHDVTFIDPSATDMTPLAIKRNHLYRITLSKAYKLDFTLEVKDWDEGETFNVTDIPVGLPEIDPTEQERMNNALLVAKLFTPFNVKTLDTKTKTVTFFDELTNDAEEESFFSYLDLDEAGLTDPSKPIADQTLKDGDNNEYRLATAGEMQLLVPMLVEYPGYFDPIDPNAVRSGDYGVMWDKTGTYNGVICESVPFKNVRKSAQTFPYGDNLVYTTELVTDPKENENGIKGHSYFKKMKITENLNATLQTECTILTTSENATKKIPYGAVYAIRFKGTSQFAAYKYEFLPVEEGGDPTNRYYSIKIKALPKDADVTIDDIAGNYTFWAKDCIEYKFPAVGIIDTKYSNEIQYKGSRFEVMGSAIRTKGYPFTIRGFVTGMNIRIRPWENKYALRLVRVLPEETPATPAE